MSVTIRELSKQCGLSISTVSKALNGYTDISAATRDVVEAAAKRLGYVPNNHARALKTKHSYNLGVLFVDDQQSGLTHSYFSNVLESFKVEAERNGYDITFISHHFGTSNMTYLTHCLSREVDGVCIACINFHEPEVIDLVMSDLPVITIDHLFNNHSCIQSDNVAGMRMLVEYVHGMGHRKIAFVHGARSTVTDMRLASFHRTAQALGLKIPENYVETCEYNDVKAAYQVVDRLLKLSDPPTCVLMSDDFATLGAYEAIEERGLRVGRDVSVAGYDGIPLMQLVRPRLTTIKQDTTRIGTEAARQLVALIQSPKTAIPEITVVPCTLIEGDTVCPIG